MKIVVAAAAYLSLCLSVPAGVQTFQVEEVNDPQFFKFPLPAPTVVRTNSFLADRPVSEHVIDIRSTSLRNLSITVENLGYAVMRKPWLFGPHGWDFRNQRELVRQITQGAASEKERFFRIFEWQSKHMYRTSGNIRGTRYYGSSDAMFLLNKYGQTLCGGTAAVTTSLLNSLEGADAIPARRAHLHAHSVGEAFYDDRWQAFDTTFRWAYYGADRRTPASWEELKSNISLLTELSEIHPWARRMAEFYLGKVEKLKYTDERRVTGENWNWNWDLWPAESITMYPEMRGRVDRISFDYATNGFPEPRDYASAVFSFNPSFTNDLFLSYAAQTSNILATKHGLIPADTGKPSWIVFGVNKFPWQFCGATIAAKFKTSGEVSILPARDFGATNFDASGEWQMLDDREEYGTNTIEGAAAYWVKFQFSGPGSGLESASIQSEVQMSRWAMPAPEPGINRIRLEGAASSAAAARVTYRYDDQCPFSHYERATRDYGRHILFRLGGLLEVCEEKGNFWKALATTPHETRQVRVRIFRMGVQDFPCVRTLLDRQLRPGYNTLYWDGCDDSGKDCPPNEMYAYRIDVNGKFYYSERLYLFPKLWPSPNGMRGGITARH